MASDIASVFRREYGAALATLVRVFGDISLAEDAVQDAFVVASERWPADGVPPNPGGWIVTTARRRAIDVVRREHRGRELSAEAAAVTAAVPLDPVDQEDDGVVRDDQLRLIFTCCHPSLSREHQLALTLRLMGGLGVDEIARVFIVSEAAMAKRLVRAKHKIAAARIPYRIPRPEDLPVRLDAVLLVVYLIYTAGVEEPARSAHLRADAIRLARELTSLLPDEPEVAGLLALCLLNEARMPARTASVPPVLLADQDRSLWDRAMIDEGHAIVRSCIAQNRPGPLQLQAAIQAVHDDAATYRATDWGQIATLYDQLWTINPTPIVALNRAIAHGESRDAHAALEQLDAVAGDLDDYHLLHAARAETLTRLGRIEEAARAYERAASCAIHDHDRRFLEGRIDELDAERTHGSGGATSPRDRTVQHRAAPTAAVASADEDLPEAPAGDETG